MATFTPGMRIQCRDAEWLVTRVEIANQKDDQIVYCTGVDDLTRGHKAAFLPQIETIIPVDPKKTKMVKDESGGYSKSKLFLEAQLRQMPLTDPEPHVKGMGAFKPMKYQEEVVRRAITQLRPRLLLADAVGLGKTIEVGMILSELMKRGQADRILVLAKKSMLAQFQAELWNRFTLPLVRLDSVGLGRLQLKIPASKNPFEVYQRIIMSIDTLKDIGRYSHFLENTRWDVVVIDEAHNVSGGTNPEKHLSFRLARRLARRSNSLILTTATPHNGKRETFGRLINLLDPSAIPDPKLREYEAADIKPFFMMRFKEDIQEEAGDNFSPRTVIPLKDTSIEAKPEEEMVYRHLASIREKILKKEIESRAIVQWGMYKSFLSSPEACQSTAEKRLMELKKQTDPASEIDYLEPLVDMLKSMNIAQSSRFKLLVRELETLQWTGKNNSPRLLIFTESRLTQEALVKAVAKHYQLKYSEKHEDQVKQALAMIHGGMADTVLSSIVESFGTGSSPIRLMIATDVASEGVNLHHQCFNLIHYDLPWSIITLIQRNGRIDRFGQMHSPVIRYLMVDSDEGLFKGDKEIFKRLVGKVDEINRSTRTGESVLKLYDAKKEEEYIAQGIMDGNEEIFDKANPQTTESAELENILTEANSEGHDDFMAFLMGETEAPKTEKIASTDNSRARLMSDVDFLEKGYKTLSDTLINEKLHPLQKTNHQLILNPSKELQRRLGAPGAGGDVIFGATSIPQEAWPDDGQLYMTTEVDRVNDAIKAALAQKGQWAQELLLCEQHPVLQWLSERLMMLMERGEAPLITSPHLEPGQLLFCFIGQVSSKAGNPLIVDPHAISFKKQGGFAIIPLKKALEDINFDNLVNSGKEGSLPDKLRAGFLTGAVEQSIQHLKQLKDQRHAIIRPRLEKEEKRLESWFHKWSMKIDAELINLPPEGKKAVRLKNQKDEMEKYISDRNKDWRDAHYLAEDEPTTRLILAVEGV